ncbi:hypothetical protein ACLB1S_09990 [Escherichia coli]
MGLEACMTLGTLSESQAQRLATPGWITTTTTWTPRRSFTAISSPPALIRNASIRSKVRAMPGSKFCSGGIVGLGETVKEYAPDYCCNWQTCRRRRKAYRSTCW